MSTNQTQRVAVRLSLDDRNRLTLSKHLRRVAPEMDSVHAVWNEERGCIELHPVTDDGGER